MQALLFLLPLIWLAVAGLAIVLAVVFEVWLPFVVGGLVAAIVLTWILGSTLSPAVPDRRCPRCGAEDGLVRLRRGEMLGVRCRRCGHVDEELYRAYLDEA